MTVHKQWCSQRVVKVLKAPQSGSQAGTTASHNRFGQYERNRRSPVQPIGNGRRAFIRAAFGASSNAWASLTGAQQAAWSSYADSHPITDSLGQSVKLTGHMMYVSVATQQQNVNAAMPTDPPISATVGPITGVALYADETGTLIVTGADTNADDVFLFGFSRQVSNGVTFMKTFCQLGFDGAAAGVWDCSGAYLAQFGALAVGQKVFLRLTPVNQYGVGGTPTIVSTSVQAAPTIPIAVATSPTAGGLTSTWSGGGSYETAEFNAPSGTQLLSDLLRIEGPAVSPIAGTGLTPGTVAFVRLTDGTIYGGPSNTVTIT